jgi:hypothetical protein
VAEREPQPDCERPLAGLHEPPRDVVNRSNVVGVDCVPQPERKRLIIAVSQPTLPPLALCRASLPFRYFGLQDGTNCFCGEAFGSQGAAAAADCGMPCPGEPGTQCGGADRNSVYSQQGPPPPQKAPTHVYIASRAPVGQGQTQAQLGVWEDGPRNTTGSWSPAANASFGQAPVDHGWMYAAKDFLDPVKGRRILLGWAQVQRACSGRAASMQGACSERAGSVQRACSERAGSVQ